MKAWWGRGCQAAREGSADAIWPLPQHKSEAVLSVLLQLHSGNHRVPHGAEPTLARWTTGPDLTSWPMVRHSNRRRKWLQVILLSLSPWPRPRLSSCISRRSKITSSWPGDGNSELQLAKPRSQQTQALGADSPPQVLREKGSETDKLSHSGENDGLLVLGERSAGEETGGPERGVLTMAVPLCDSGLRPGPWA